MLLKILNNVKIYVHSLPFALIKIEKVKEMLSEGELGKTVPYFTNLYINQCYRKQYYINYSSALSLCVSCHSQLAIKNFASSSVTPWKIGQTVSGIKLSTLWQFNHLFSIIQIIMYV